MRLENAYKLDSGSGSGGNNKGGEGGGGGGGGGGGDGSNRWESVLFSFLHAAAFFALSLFGFSHVARGAAAKANASAGASAETQARSSALRSWCRLMSMALLFVTLPYLLPLAVLCARASVSALQVRARGAARIIVRSAQPLSRRLTMYDVPTLSSSL